MKIHSQRGFLYLISAIILIFVGALVIGHFFNFFSKEEAVKATSCSVSLDDPTSDPAIEVGQSFTMSCTLTLGGKGLGYLYGQYDEGSDQSSWATISTSSMGLSTQDDNPVQFSASMSQHWTIDGSDPGIYYVRCYAVSGLDNCTSPTTQKITVSAAAGTTSTYEQASWRWFENLDSTQVGPPLADQNASAILSDVGQFRLRMLLHIDQATSSPASSTFKLQVATSTIGGCDTGFSGETYVDVDTSSGDIRFYDNASINDGDLLTATGTDPTHGGDTVVNQTYEESNNFQVTSTISVGQDGMWDFALDYTGGSEAAYCFRAVYSSSTLFDTYTVIPEIDINQSPTVSDVVLNNDHAITLTANATTTVTAVASTSDPNGVGDILSATGTIYRSGVGGGCVADNLNCYQISACSFIDSTSTVSCSADIYYFADATDASSSYSAQDWQATITVTDSGGKAGSSSTASGVELNTLLAINISTSAIDYGTVDAGSDTGSINEVTTVENAGNVSSSLQLSGTALVLETNEIATNSQHYATGTFSFGGSEVALNEVATGVDGIFLQKKVGLNSSIGTWVQTQSLPGVLEDAAVSFYGGNAYHIGGNTSTVLYAPINTDGTIGSWTETTAIQAALSNHGAFSHDGYLYVLGGAVGGTETSTVLYAPINTDGTIGSWTETTALPSALAEFSATFNPGYIYVIGGEDSSFNITSTVLYAPINTDGTIGSWTETTALPNVLQNHATISNYSYLYISGGIPSTDGINVTSTVLYAPINTDGTIGSWTGTTAMPNELYEHTFTIGNRDVYVIGGRSSYDFEVPGSGEVTSTVLYAPINTDGTIGSWTETTALPVERYMHVSFLRKGYLYTLGGRSDDGITSSVFYAPITNGMSYDRVFWGIEITGGKPTGTYSGTNYFDAVFEE